MNDCILHIENGSNSPELPEDEDPPSWICACLGLEQVQTVLDSRLPTFGITYLDINEARELNKTYRHKDYATNVLSFPAEIPDFIKSIEDGFTLGDLIICPSVVQREAEEQGKSLSHHFAHLIIHGFLHLIGLDHETDEEAHSMEAIEILALSTLGIANPYETHSNNSSELSTLIQPQIPTPQLERM